MLTGLIIHYGGRDLKKRVDVNFSLSLWPSDCRLTFLLLASGNLVREHVSCTGSRTLFLVKGRSYDADQCF